MPAPARSPTRSSDFVRGTDRIDLSAIDANPGDAGGNDAFTFIGTGAFTNVAGELRYEVTAATPISSPTSTATASPTCEIIVNNNTILAGIGLLPLGRWRCGARLAAAL